MPSPKTLIFAVLISFAINANAQVQFEDSAYKSFKDVMLSKHWETDRILGLDTAIRTYTFSSYEEAEEEITVGNITQFVDSVNYHSEYVAWCGNDNFREVFGKYEFIDSNKIRIKVERVVYTGLELKPTEYRKPKYQSFLISIDGDMIVFTKLD